MQVQVHFLAALVFCSAISFPAASATLSLQPCRLEGAQAAGSAAARCGTYRVREDRDSPDSKELQLHVAVVPALRLEPHPDPLFIFAGGPGQAASDFYLAASPAFGRIRRDRDIVLVDQRGTGRSHRLECALPDDADMPVVEPERLKPMVRDCLRGLGGDPRFYTTSIAVRDLDEIRAALGYEAINLYGVSYGTRVAQHYMRRYPKRVRTAILDGVVPAELALGPDVATDAQRALDNTFARCAADTACGREFPHIAQQFEALRTRLNSAPVSVSITDPRTAAVTPATLDAARLGAAVRLLTYSDETTSTLPLLIHQAQVLERPHGLAAQYLMIRRTADEQIANGMHFAVVCSEDAPRWPPPDTDEAASRTYMGTDFMRGMRAICAEWPRGPVDADFSQPMRSELPVLVLSGGNDPITPARYGEQILPGYPNSKHLVLAGQGHGQIATGCVPRLAADFIARGSAAGLEDDCVRNVAPAAFMMSPVATAP